MSDKKSLSVALSVAKLARKKDKAHKMAEASVSPERAQSSGVPQKMSLMAALKRARKAKDEQADLDLNAEEIQPHNMDEQNEEAALKELYDLDQVSDQPEDSNLHGDDLEDSDEDNRDMIALIRKRMKSKHA
jgi:hypothetical protein